MKKEGKSGLAYKISLIGILIICILFTNAFIFINYRFNKNKINKISVVLQEQNAKLHDGKDKKKINDLKDEIDSITRQNIENSDDEYKDIVDTYLSDENQYNDLKKENSDLKKEKEEVKAKYDEYTKKFNEAQDKLIELQNKLYDMENQ